MCNQIEIAAQYKSVTKTQPTRNMTWPELQQAAKKPASTEKDVTSCIHPSTAPAKTKAAVEQHDSMTLLWADIDSGDISLDELKQRAMDHNLHNYIIYSTATANRMKKGKKQGNRWRVLVPLANTVPCAYWYQFQQTMMQIFSSGSEALRVQQIMFLPTNPDGGYYEYHIEKGIFLDPDNLPAQIGTLLKEIESEQNQQQKITQNAPIAPRKVDKGEGGIIDLVNKDYPVESCLSGLGYDYYPGADRWLHPDSTSGKPGVILLNGKYYSHHSSGTDPLADRHTHDSFDLLCHWQFGGDISTAVKHYANELDPQGQKERQREYMEEQEKIEEEEKPELKYLDPQPLPDALLPVEPFDYDLLPETFQPWVRDVCERMQCPPDFVAVTVIAALAAVIGRKVAIRPQKKDAWTVVVNMWAIVIGRPGVMKSPALSEALKPLDKLVARAQKEFSEAETEYKKTSAITEFKKDASKKQIRKKLEEDINCNISDLLGDDEPDTPMLKRYKANDQTYQALGELLRHNQNGLLVFRDEIVSLLKSLDKEDQSEARGFYLTAWNGDSPYTFDRIGRGLNLHIPATCISMVGGTQPGKISQYVQQAVKGGTGDDGLIQRFGLMVWPDISTLWKNVDRWPDKEAKNDAFRVFDRLDELDHVSLDAEQDTDFDGNPEGLPFLRFTPEAQEIFLEWRERMEPLWRSDELPEALSAHFSKYRKLIPGLALILHLAEGDSGPVSESAIIRALAWGDYLETHARRVYGCLTHYETTAAEAIITKLKQGKLNHQFSSKEVWRPKWSKLTDREQVEAALQLLVDYDWLTKSMKTGTGGRNATFYEVNPGIL